jgi:ankyrin repeat protein
MKTTYWLACLLAGFISLIPASNAATEKEIKQQLDDYLWNAAREGNNDVVDTFIEGKYNLNAQNSQGYTAIILAAYHGHRTVVERLLSAGADPCIRDKRGNTALMGAIFKGEVRIARQLLATSCNPDTRNNAGQTAAMYASLFQQNELLAELKAKGADMGATDVNGNSVSSLAEGEINGQSY